MRRGSKVILCGGLWRWMMKQAGRQAVDYYVQMESHCITVHTLCTLHIVCHLCQ